SVASNQPESIGGLGQPRRGPRLHCRHATRRRHRAPRPQGRQLRPHLPDAGAGGHLRAPRPGPRALVAAVAGLVAGPARGAGAGAHPRHGRRAAAAGLGRAAARPQLHGGRGDVPASAARRRGLVPCRPAAAAGTAPARRGPQRPGQGGELARARGRAPGADRLPARQPRRSALAVDAAAVPRGPAPPAQAQAHVLPRGAHSRGAARAAAQLVGARPVVPHRQAGLPVRDPADPEVGRQRGAGAQALNAAPHRDGASMNTLSGKTLFITGASRGIGLAIALRAARDGANVAIAAKSAVPNPKLPGTIHTAAGAVEAAGGRALALQCDIREEAQVQAAVAKTVEAFGGIDILVNNASAIWLRGTLDTPMKRFDLMQQVNARGTFLCAQACLPHLLQAPNPHILTLAPPPSLDPKWWAPHTGYTLAKMGMSFVTLGLAAEFADRGIAINALWPRTLIA